MKLPAMTGFGNDFATEALPGALPQGQNSPQNCPYGLYAEQLSGSPFTAPRATNERSWLYRISPSVLHFGQFGRITQPLWHTAPHRPAHNLPLGPLRWAPVPVPDAPLSFFDGIRTITSAGDADSRIGCAIHLYLANAPMADRYFANADGEMLIVPQTGALRIATELGVIELGPAEIAVIPRGMIFRVDPLGATARGYICENYGAPFTLPDRGPIGANCLANARDFKTPVAAYEDRADPGQLILKWGGQFHQKTLTHSPLDVVAWHGNYAPYSYNLRHFAPIGAIGFDHPDPSIFTVLTAPSGEAGTANIDFVIFPERWMVAEHSFRPPWYHRNIMSEFMGLIEGQYDAKETGFAPGAMSLHNAMLPHGPDTEAFLKASTANLVPTKLTNTLAFMFETRLPQYITEFSATLPTLDQNYAACWQALPRRFDPTNREGRGL
ncbi:MAG TPA: homogentisate 1,2-dioxygenase [Acidiphilium sp.]|nr:MAG: homogentisate 1,2-dioxygenase [Acidiphilium sp. 21-60-14]OYV90678.1 MAG: homogentisate 1,2-dioxygenase [Acidiphilium sp. 37-60-79]OZB41534.1 MAG: homogentisate 1,2-dioxygenase [Acidiphilium sp. 34-60-192]HQT87595.1 homogentisate 1,2-dioxygenase [Acidiphilium sp.]HQU24174.1 homogentisate 1,2-dioxygenase [Acidiphilium sp.]